MTHYSLEVLFWGLRDVRPALAPGFQYVNLHIGGEVVESCRLDPASSLNFQEPFVSADLVRSTTLKGWEVGNLTQPNL